MVRRKSVSFPSISTGAFGYPVRLAAAVALETVIDFLHQGETLEEVVFVLFDDATCLIYTHVLEELLPEAG